MNAGLAGKGCLLGSYLLGSRAFSEQLNTVGVGTASLQASEAQHYRPLCGPGWGAVSVICPAGLLATTVLSCETSQKHWTRSLQKART